MGSDPVFMGAGTPATAGTGDDDIGRERDVGKTSRDAFPMQAHRCPQSTNELMHCLILSNKLFFYFVFFKVLLQTN